MKHPQSGWRAHSEAEARLLSLRPYPETLFRYFLHQSQKKKRKKFVLRNKFKARKLSRSRSRSLPKLKLTMMMMRGHVGWIRAEGILGSCRARSAPRTPHQSWSVVCETRKIIVSLFHLCNYLFFWFPLYYGSMCI